MRTTEERNRLVTENLGFAIEEAARVQSDDRDDVQQEAFLASVEAADTFDEEKGRFTTHAAHRIRGRVKDFQYGERSTLRVPAYQHRQISRFQTMESAVAQELGRKPTFEEVADAMGLKEPQRGTLWRAVSSQRMEAQPIEQVSEHSSILDGLADSEERFLLRLNLAWLARVDPLAFKAVQARFGLNGGGDRDYDRVGEIMGVSGERARKLADRGLARLRSAMDWYNVEE